MNHYLMFILLTLSICIAIGCGNNHPTPPIPDNDQTAQIELDEVVSKEVTVEKQKEKEKIIKKDKSEIEKAKVIKASVEKKSLFNELGCCKKEKQKTKDGCCCKEVLEQYKVLRKEDNRDKIKKIKQTDPIFNACKELLYKEFDCVDYPEECQTEKKKSLI